MRERPSRNTHLAWWAIKCSSHLKLPCCRSAGCNCTYPDLTSFLRSFLPAAQAGHKPAIPAEEPSSRHSHASSDRTLHAGRTAVAPPSGSAASHAAQTTAGSGITDPSGSTCCPLGIAEGSIRIDASAQPSSTNSSGTNTSVELPDVVRRSDVDQPSLAEHDSQRPQGHSTALPSQLNGPIPHPGPEISEQATAHESQQEAPGPDQTAKAASSPAKAPMAAKDVAILADALKQVTFQTSELGQMICKSSSESCSRRCVWKRGGGGGHGFARWTIPGAGDCNAGARGNRPMRLELSKCASQSETKPCSK